MSKLIVLNHKMNLEYDEIFPYIDQLNSIETEYNIIACPSNIYLTEFMNHCSWGIGSQNVSEYDEEKYTGEISALQLKSIGIEYAIIGHYERKKYFHETEENIHNKLITCLESNIIPILCFGETGKSEDIIKSLENLLKDIENIDFIVFAYEPLKIKEQETIENIEQQINLIYNYLHKKYHTKPNIIYGGRLINKNISTILNIENLNGLLIEESSKDIKKIEKIVIKK